MTEPKNWLDEVLARHRAEPVPPGFKIRLIGRIHEASRRKSQILPFRIPLLLAAGLVILATGYWMGMGAPSLSPPTQIGSGGDFASLDLEDLYDNRNLLEAWELLQDPELELGFGETVAGTWASGISDAAGSEPR